ncbi:MULTISPECIES: YegP family protein [Olsenella]|uniref:YegP family protein n=2 Tax=Atopobiaceae TaxID=1643824 RepID=UPI0007830909|nr:MULTISPECIES: YegP family protein [Olsenella]KXB63903.1 hypothetical protein HMPREF1868_00417 [Olsenella sp. DNF00959]
MGQYVMVEKEGLYQFNLCDSNGHVVLASTVYPSREECLAGMDSTRALAVGAPVQDGTVHGFGRVAAPKCRIYQQLDGKYYFVLVDDAGDALGRSHAYPKKESLLRRIERMRKESSSPLALEE